MKKTKETKGTQATASKNATSLRSLESPASLDSKDPAAVQAAFAQIAKRYDLANHVLSLGLDFVWRHRAAALVAATQPRRVLDVATGSGDLAVSLKRACRNAEVVGMDFCAPMLDIARRKGVNAVEGDALAMPFCTGEFDAVTVAFGLRNMTSYRDALLEMKRVLRPDGFLLVMDFSMPRLFAAPYRFYLHRILPVFAGLLTGRSETYRYLGDSIETFPRNEAMQSLLAECGFTPLPPRALAGGIAAIHSAHSQ